VVVRTVRWQRPVRAALHAGGELAGALVDGVALVLGIGQKNRGKGS